MSRISDNRNLSDEIKEMIELGLWPRRIPNPDSQILERIHRLDEEILKREYEFLLADTDAQLFVDKVKEKYHEKSIERREERKKELIQATQKKLKVWKDLQKNNFTHLGSNVSSWLNDTKCDKKNLKKYDLPIINSPKSLSKFLNIDIPVIKWLSYHRKVSKIIHYIDFTIPKTSGGKRFISMPKEKLHLVQKPIKQKILDKIKWRGDIFGFIKSRSIYSNALFHRNTQLIVNVDIKDFFYSINYFQVRAAFKRLGYSGQIATILALLTTKQNNTGIEIKAKKYNVFSDYRYLPQGSCSSPGLSNLISSNIDNQLSTRSKNLGFKYTRYADDLTFSSDILKPQIKALLYMIKKTLQLHGFEVNKAKTRILGKNKRQSITGLVINSGQPKIPRVWRRNLRAAIHQLPNITKDRQEIETIRLLGSVEYLKLTHPSVAKKYKRKLLRYL